MILRSRRSGSRQTAWACVTQPSAAGEKTRRGALAAAAEDKAGLLEEAQAAMMPVIRPWRFKAITADRVILALRDITVVKHFLICLFC